MDIRWKQLVLSAMLWMVAEVVLTFTGMDGLADYGEYHFSYQVSPRPSHPGVAIRLAQSGWLGIPGRVFTSGAFAFGAEDC
ncbi:MAG: hypothetical protein O2890_00230 [Cyanobacteria bacterium]|nr:hypothetical protein [Cyanobacteriota bacterium]MDA0864861.1 hypothetical protein [Cyanobacteriota bacterium]